MKIQSLDELQVYQLALAVADEVSAILQRPSFTRDLELRRQLANCSGRIGAQIAEGYGQGTDRHCAHYQRIARGSSNEMCSHLSVACGRGLISEEEKARLVEKYEVIGKKLTKWIQHLS